MATLLALSGSMAGIDMAGMDFEGFPSRSGMSSFRQSSASLSIPIPAVAFCTGWQSDMSQTAASQRVTQGMQYYTYSCNSPRQVGLQSIRLIHS
jgi:hypothetical protein